MRLGTHTSRKAENSGRTSGRCIQLPGSVEFRVDFVSQDTRGIQVIRRGISDSSKSRIIFCGVRIDGILQLNMTREDRANVTSSLIDQYIGINLLGNLN
jgi:hypothetical protein